MLSGVYLGIARTPKISKPRNGRPKVLVLSERAHAKILSKAQGMSPVTGIHPSRFNIHSGKLTQLIMEKKHMSDVLSQEKVRNFHVLC